MDRLVWEVLDRAAYRRTGDAPFAAERYLTPTDPSRSLAPYRHVTNREQRSVGSALFSPLPLSGLRVAVEVPGGAAWPPRDRNPSFRGCGMALPVLTPPPLQDSGAKHGHTC